MKNRIALNINRALICTALLGLSCGAACNIVAPIAFLLEGPPTNPAVADLQPDRTTVIFVDDRNSRLPKRALRSEIAKVAEQMLLDKGIINKDRMISASSALRAASGESAEEPLSIVDVGRAVGAEVIVYADVQVFTLSRDGVSVSPAAALDIKIIDTITNERLWPEGDAGYPLIIRLPESQGQVFGLSLSERSNSERQLAQTVGMRIAQMFYKTERTTGLGQ